MFTRLAVVILSVAMFSEAVAQETGLAQADIADYRDHGFDLLMVNH